MRLIIGNIDVVFETNQEFDHLKLEFCVTVSKTLEVCGALPSEPLGNLPRRSFYET